MGVALNDVIILLQELKNGIGLYSKSNRKIKEMIFLRDETAETDCDPVTIWHDSASSKVYLERSASFPAYQIQGQHINLWQDGTNIVIGVGDMRDGITVTYIVPLSTLAKDEFVIQHNDINDISVWTKYPPDQIKVAGSDTTNIQITYC